MLCRKCNKAIPDGALYCSWCGAKQTVQLKKPKKRGNGTGTVYKLPDGKYMAEITVSYFNSDDGKRHRKKRTKTCIKSKDAWAALETLRDKQTEMKKPLTLYQLKKIFEKSKKYDKLSTSQQNKLEYAWKRLAPIHHTKITELSLDTMQITVDEAVKTYYPARDMKVLLSHLYKLAIQREFVLHNLSEYIELPDPPIAKREVFTDSEVEALWKDYNGENKDGLIHADKRNLFTGYILIMIYTGMRYGELAKIRKENVFLDKRYMIGGEKTEAGRDREIAIAKKILPIVTEKYNTGKKKLLEMNTDNFYNEYWNTIERIRIRHLPPQVCRHTYFTLLTREKVHPGLIASMGGHAQYQTAIDNYNRLPVEDKIMAVDKL